MTISIADGLVLETNSTLNTTPIVKLTKLGLSFAASLSALSLTTQAAVVCSDSVATLSNPGYQDCAGPFSGNINGSPSELTDLTSLFGGTWDYRGKSDDLNNGPFTSNPEVVSGTLTFDTPQTGVFVLGIKGGPSYSYYLFDVGNTATSSMAFDTLGIFKGNGQPGPDLSHAALYVQVPEPAEYAVLFGGLAVGTFFLRRRR